MALFTGEAVHAYLGHLSDEAIVAMLNELSIELGAALGQERIYVAFADRTWIADAVGVPVDRLLPAFQDAVRHPLPWVEVKTAPAQEVVHEKVDLLKQLPIPKHNELDSGPYITAASDER